MKIRQEPNNILRALGSKWKFLITMWAMRLTQKSTRTCLQYHDIYQRICPNPYTTDNPFKVLEGRRRCTMPGKVGCGSLTAS